jgi:hypothetical protein
MKPRNSKARNLSTRRATAFLSRRSVLHVVDRSHVFTYERFLGFWSGLLQKFVSLWVLYLVIHFSVDLCSRVTCLLVPHFTDGAGNGLTEICRCMWYSLSCKNVIVFLNKRLTQYSRGILKSLLPYNSEVKVYYYFVKSQFFKPYRRGGAQQGEATQIPTHEQWQLEMNITGACPWPQFYGTSSHVATRNCRRTVSVSEIIIALNTLKHNGNFMYHLP